MTAGVEAGGALPTATPGETRRRIAGLLRTRRAGVFAVVALTGASTAATLAGPALIGVVVDAALGGGGATTVDRAALAYAGLAVVAAVLQYAAGARAAVVGESALAEIRTEVFDHALGAPVDAVEQAGTGDLVSRVTGDVNVLARAVRSTVPDVTFAVIEAVLTIGALALIDVRLAAAAMAAGGPVAAVGGWWYFRYAPARYRAEREAHGGLAGGLLEAYRGRKTLAAYRAGRRWRHDLVGLGQATIAAELATTSARNRLRPAVSAAPVAALVAVVAVGAALADGGAVTVGAVGAAALYVIRLFDPIGTLLEETDEIQQSTAAVARLVGVTQLPSIPHRAATEHGGPLVPQVHSAGVGIEISGVDFGYRKTEPVLRAVDLTVAPGERIAVVGPSGAGKTTLAKLVCGTYTPWAGEVRLGGTPIDQIDAAMLPRIVAMVAQEGHVFARSVADNVCLARPDVDDAAVCIALDAVDALGWAEALPDGLRTVVGSGHHPLTPPQAQQLGLARLVCADPAVVILDEATADLDPTAAARTERHLATALAGRTVIAIAHRLDAATRADRVVVLDAGTVVATGAHTDLLAAGGTYTDLWAHWTADRGLAPEQTNLTTDNETR